MRPGSGRALSSSPDSGVFCLPCAVWHRPAWPPAPAWPCPGVWRAPWPQATDFMVSGRGHSQPSAFPREPSVCLVGSPWCPLRVARPPFFRACGPLVGGAPGGHRAGCCSRSRISGARAVCPPSLGPGRAPCCRPASRDTCCVAPGVRAAQGGVWCAGPSVRLNGFFAVFQVLILTTNMRGSSLFGP